MAKYFKLTVSSMTMHNLYIRTPDDINEDDIHRNFRKFDGGMFTTDDDGDWEYSSTEEIDKENFLEESCQCNWEDKYE